MTDLRIKRMWYDHDFSILAEYIACAFGFSATSITCCGVEIAFMQHSLHVFNYIAPIDISLVLLMLISNGIVKRKEDMAPRRFK